MAAQKAKPMRPIYQLGRLVSFLFGQGFCAERIYGLRHVPLRIPVLMAANHQSFFDPMLLTYPIERECHYMARDTLFRNRYFAALIRTVNAYPIKRSTADMAGVKETLRRLKAGALVLTFPEGTRTPDGRVYPFHPGVLTIARKAGVPIIPAAVEGAFEVWPRGGRIPRPTRVWVQYGPAVPQELIHSTDARAAALELTGIVRALHNRLRVRVGRPPLEYDPALDSPTVVDDEHPPAPGATPASSLA